MTYQRKPEIVEAILISKNEIVSVELFLRGVDNYVYENGQLNITTPNTIITALMGQYLVKDSNGNISVFNDYDFYEMFTLV